MFVPEVRSLMIVYLFITCLEWWVNLADSMAAYVWGLPSLHCCRMALKGKVAFFSLTICLISCS